MFRRKINIFSLQHAVCSQNIESLYMADFETWQTIYTITNRPFEQTGNEFNFINDVTPDTSLLYLKITFSRPDSLDIKVIVFSWAGGGVVIQNRSCHLSDKKKLLINY